MSFLNITKATLSTLSPVHLGSGEDFLPTNYVIDDDGWLHSFNEMVIAQAIGNKITQIQNIIHKEKGEQMLLSLQRLIHENRQVLSTLASHSLPVASGFQQLYKNRIGQVAQREGHRNIVNQLPIMRTFINPHTHLPVITGSAIKGAIRTAILNQLAQNKGWKKSQDVQNPRNLQKDLIGFNNPTTDPLKLLKISDGEYKNAENLPATEILFAVSKRRIAKEGKTAGGPTTYLEAISGFRRHSFSFDLRLLHNPSQDSQNKLPKDIKGLAKLCNDYYVPKLKKELGELGHMNYLDEKFLQGLICLLDGELGVALQNNQAFLLRLGKHSGAFHKTLDNVRAIEIPQHKTSMMVNGREKKIPLKVSETPEVRLAATLSLQQAVDLLPFGWVIISLNDHPLPNTYTFLDEQAKQAGAFKQRDALQQLRQNQAAQQAKLAELEKQKQVEAQKKALEQAALERKRQEESQKPLHTQNLNAFKQAFEEDKKTSKSKNRQFQQPASPLGQALIGLFNNYSSDWPSEAIEELRTLSTEVFNYLGVDRKKNATAKNMWQKLTQQG